MGKLTTKYLNKRSNCPGFHCGGREEARAGLEAGWAGWVPKQTVLPGSKSLDMLLVQTEIRLKSKVFCRGWARA